MKISLTCTHEYLHRDFTLDLTSILVVLGENENEASLTIFQKIIDSTYDSRNNTGNYIPTTASKGCRGFTLAISAQDSHRSGNSGKFLKTFSSQGNQGKTGVFQPKSGKNISNQGTFVFKPFSNLLDL